MPRHLLAIHPCKQQAFTHPPPDGQPPVVKDVRVALQQGNRQPHVSRLLLLLKTRVHAHSEYNWLP